jgi:hypothetical protein
MVNGFVIALVRTERAAAPDPAQAAAQFGPLLERILDGLIGPVGLPAPVVVAVAAAAEQAADDEKHEDERP